MGERSNKDLAARFSKLATPPANQPPAPQQQPQVEQTQRPSKFTVVFSRPDAEAFDELLLTMRRRLGRRVDKSEVVRALLALTYDDPSLEAQLVEHLRGDRDQQ